MFLHLGGGTAIHTREILGIYARSLLSDEALKDFEAKGRVIHLEAPDREAKSVILTDAKIYLSILTPTTLASRTKWTFDAFA